KAYLVARGVEEVDFEYVEQVMKRSGDPLETVLNDDYLQTKLKERKDQRMAEAATPSGSKRAGQSGADSVDYWLAKVNSGQTTVGQIPDRKLRQQVVNARMKAEQEKSQFYN